MSDIDIILDRDLTDEQRAAARDETEEVLALACAGSGKSRTLAYRIARLVAPPSEQSPKGIVAFTFTEKAADSIKLRVAQALEAAGLDPTKLGAMYVGTIHSYCQYVLGEMDARYRQFDVLDENRLKLYLISRAKDLGLFDLQKRRKARYFETIKEVADAWKTLNDEVLSIEDVKAQDLPLGEVLETLDARLDQDEFIDFSLMIRLAVEALERRDEGAERAVSELAHLMVDEYQDVNPAQEALVRELYSRSQTLFVVGDDDQAIYGWRGADVGNIIEFERRYPNCAVHTLSRNFRSTEAIVAAADEFAAAELGATRITKSPQAVNPPGPRDFRNLWFETRQEEAEWVAQRISDLLETSYIEQNGAVRGLTPADFAILMRSTRGSEQDGSARHDAFTRALTARRIPYTLEAGGGVFDREQVSVMRDTFELLRQQSPDRNVAKAHFDAVVSPAFPYANFNAFVRVLADWGRRIHAPIKGPRRRVYPQQLVHDLLHAFGIEESDFDAGVMQDLGIFSRMMQDVEAVYLSIDTTSRFREILNFLQNVAETGYDTSTQDVLRRPDAVTVATVHKVKGLEFPAVFVSDVEARRFPGDKRKYSGWLPTSVLKSALDRGAYQGTREEEARLFYTAVTRAERYLYVTGSRELPGAKKPRQPSPFSQRLLHDEIRSDADEMPAGLEAHERVRRIDETILPTSYSEIRYYLRCPRDYQFRKSFGFSPPITEMFGFGMTVHAAVGKLHETFQNSVPTPGEAEAIARSVFHLKHVPQSSDPENRPGGYEQAKASAARIVGHYAENHSEDFARKRQVEVRFEVPVEQAVISGTIDLLLDEDPDGNILDARVVDFKTMEGGPEPEQNEDLHWTELALQVQLYAKAAREVLGENARTGAVHLLKDGQRVDVPVTDSAVSTAVANVEWAVTRILAGDFPMRPYPEKCVNCDFKALCPQRPEGFKTDEVPSPIAVPTGEEMARSFSEFVDD
ncbi:MAG: ATP-dependent helicase [Actinomycetota bacterium]|nr:ATP-dependent helicase [Actinomycetota bacterium]